MTVYLGSTATLYPRLKVEIAFQDDPYATSITWTDVTSYVRSEVSCKRGRNYELNKNEAGTASFSLENTDGRFSPLNISSPYYPYVLPYRPVRVTCTDAAGTVYSIFRGFVERWPQVWGQAGNYGTVPVTAVDASKTTLVKIFGLRYFETVTGDNPVWYWRYDATVGRTLNSGTSGTSQTSSWTGTDSANVTQSFVDGAGPSGGDTAVRAVWTNASNKPDDATAGSQSWMNNISNGGYNTGTTPGSVSVEDVWWMPDSVPSTDGQFVRVIGRHKNTSAAATGLEVAVDATFDASGPRYAFRYYANGATGAGTLVTGSADVIPTAGRWDHIAMRQTYNSGTSKVFELYVNGVLVASVTQVSGAAAASSAAALNGAYNVPAGFACQWGEFATYNTGSSPAGNTSVASILNRASYQSTYAEFPEQTTSVRVTALLDTIGWPSALRSVETGASTVQATGSLVGKTARDVLQAAADDELGNVFVDASGSIVFHNRAHRNSAASVCTFGEGAGEVPYVEGVQVDFDDTYVQNRVEVTQSGSSPTYVAVAFDDASQTTYGLRTLTRSTAVSASADVDGQAATLLARYKQPVARLSALPVEIKSNPSVIATVLAREIGELVTVKRRPLGAPTISLDVFVDGIEDRVSPTGWTRTFLLTPKFADSTY